MRTVQEIEASLPNLSTDELQHIERSIHDLYRARHEHIIYDYDYGVWNRTRIRYRRQQRFLNCLMRNLTNESKLC